MVWAAASLALVAFALPLVGLGARVPWGRAIATLDDPVARDALLLSMVVSFSAVAIGLVLGVPLGWMLARVRSRAVGVVARAVVLIPVLLPPVVGGVALMAALGRAGLVGGALERVGIVLPFTTAGTIVAVSFVSVPLLVLAAEAGFRGVDPRLEAAASTLGARPWTVLRRVTLAGAAPAIAAGAVLTWARALGEFGASITFAGNLRGRTQTLPLAVYELLGADPDGALAVSALLVVVAIVLLVLLRGGVRR